MFNRILVPLDGSELAEQVLPHVIELAYHTDAQIILLCVPEVPANGYLLHPPRSGLTVYQNAEAEIRDYLDRISGNLRDMELDVRTVIADDGSVYSTILNKARELGVDLIAMSTHGRSGLARLVMGSVADDVVRHAQSPVLLVRPHPVHGSIPVHEHTARVCLPMN
jgi:nucleotide-binding universal stress UspA family protein